LFARLTADRDPAAREAIVRHFMPLARQLARRYRHAEDLDDLEQIAALGRSATPAQLAERAGSTVEQVLEAPPGRDRP
jgi:hypothetical protein